MVVRSLALALFVAIVAVALAGCASSEPQMTTTAVYAQAQAGVVNLRGTATVVRARMKTTLDYAGTRVRQAEDAADLLRFSLISLGTASSFVETSISQIEELPTLAARATRPGGAAPAIQAIRPAARPTVTPAVVVTSPAVAAPGEDENGPRLESILMASGVDANDCAIDANPVFTPQSEAIYVVAKAFNISSGATISSRWYRRGTEVAYFSFEAEIDIDGNCIWFFIDQTDTPFVPGAWSIEILVDDVAVAAPIVFQIAES